MTNILSPLGFLLTALIFWFLAFDIAENFSFAFLNVILFGFAIGFTVGFIIDAVDLVKSGVAISSDD